MYCKTLVVVTLMWTALSWGFLHGQMAGLIGALQKKEDGIDLSEAEISFLGASLFLFGMIGVILTALLSEKFGRRWCLIIFSLSLHLNWIILYFAKTFFYLLLSRFFASLSNSAIWAITTTASSEYELRSARAVLLSVVGMVVPAFGIGVGHVLGILYHWRTTAIVGIVLSSVHVLAPYFWVESPHWLASKGQFDACERAFTELHRHEKSYEHELKLLLKLETKKKKDAIESNANHSLKKLIRAFKKRYFWNIMLINTFVIIYSAVAGKVIFTNLATVILEGMTGTSDVLLYTVIVDGFVFAGTCISCFLIKKMSIRALLFSSGLTANVVLIALSASLYFKSSEGYFQWINVTLLALYFIIVNAGPYPVIEILLGELFPLELKMYCLFLATPTIICSIFLCLLLLPYTVRAIGYHGLFLLNSGVVFICLGYLYMRLPETKGKTLQEIELYFQTNSYDVDHVLDTSENTNNLL